MDHDSERDEAITEARIAGTSARAIARQHRCTSTEVEAAVDRRLDYALDNNMRMRLIKLNIERLEGLMKPFYEKAVTDKDCAAGLLCCKLAERLSLLLGLDSPTRVDVVQMQAQEQPSGYAKIRAAIYAVARPGQFRPPPDATNGGSDPQ